MPRTTHRTLSKMWCTIRNFLFRIVLGIVKADHRIEICNKSSKAVLSDYVHPRRVPLREDRLEQPRTDFRVQSVILPTNSCVSHLVSAMSYEPLLRDMVIEVSKVEYSKHIVDRVCYGVLARRLEVADRVCAVHVIQGTSTHQRCDQHNLR